MISESHCKPALTLPEEQHHEQHLCQRRRAIPHRGARRHAHRLGCADQDGRRRRAARRRLPPGQGRQIPGHHQLRALRQMAALPGRLSRPVAEAGKKLPPLSRALVEPLPELGTRRPGNLGAGRLRLRARGFARRGPLARLSRPVVAARGGGFRDLHRLGRRAAVVERQGRTQRHLLLRHEPVAGGVAAAEAPHRDVRVGRRRRFLPRHGPSRRHRSAASPRPGSARPSRRASTARARTATRAASTASGFPARRR